MRYALHMASTDSYKVTLYSAAGAVLTTFGVQAAAHDEAKRATKTWLESRGYTVRSINFSPKHPLAITAYAKPPATTK